MQTKDGNLFHAMLESVVTPDLDGDAGQFRIGITDISERKQAEKALLVNQKNLNDISSVRLGFCMF